MHLLSDGGPWPALGERKRRVEEILNGGPEETEEEDEDDSEISDLQRMALHHDLGEQWEALPSLHDIVARYSWEHRADAALMPDKTAAL